VSVKISLKTASDRYGVSERTVKRLADKYEVVMFEDRTFDRYQLDALFDHYANPQYSEIKWKNAACKTLPPDMFFKIEEKNVRAVVGIDVFRFTCIPCPIWKQCLNYGAHHENYGVWGGMTTEERRALLSPRKSDLKTKVLKDFAVYGITETMINEAMGNV